MNGHTQSANFFIVVVHSFFFGLGVCLVPLAWVVFVLVRRGKPASEATLRQVRVAGLARRAATTST